MKIFFMIIKYLSQMRLTTINKELVNEESIHFHENNISIELANEKSISFYENNTSIENTNL